MNKIISLVIGAVAVVGLILGAVAINKAGSNGSNGLSGVQGQKGDKGDTGARGPQGIAGRDGSTKLGAVSGPDTYFPYVANNNLQKFGQTRGLSTATTTVCAIQSPVSTSTLSFSSVNFIVGSTTATTITLAKAATAFATTTILTETTLAANAQGTFMASSTPLLATGLIGNTVFAPSQWFVVGMAGGIGTFSPVGSCSAEFIRN